MNANYPKRQAVYEALEVSHGAEFANNLMELLPLHPESELATRTDLHANTIAIGSDMAELRGELRGEMVELRTDLRGEMAELGSDLRGEMTELRTDLRGEMADLRVDLTTEMSRRFDQLTRWLLGLIATNLVAIFAAAFAILAM